MTGDMPPLAPLHCVLEFLHTGDVGALRRPPRYQLYDDEVLDHLLERLARLGARARGNVDGAPESWIEPLELLDYRIGYWHAMSVGWIACLESRIAYPADLVRDRSKPVQHPAAVKPNYRRIVLSVRVETAPLLREIERVSRVDPVPNGDGWQTVRAKTALRGLYPPDGRIPEGVTIKVVRGRVADWLDFNEPRPNTGERVPPPSWDVISRIRKSQRTPSA